MYLRLMVPKCSPHSLPCYHAHLLARRALLSLGWPPQTQSRGHYPHFLGALCLMSLRLSWEVQP